MDLSRFKSATHDADFFYLEHLDRGPFKVAKKGLSPALRRQIEEFCKGGMVGGEVQHYAFGTGKEGAQPSPLSGLTAPVIDPVSTPADTAAINALVRAAAPQALTHEKPATAPIDVSASPLGGALDTTVRAVEQATGMPLSGPGSMVGEHDPAADKANAAYQYGANVLQNLGEQTPVKPVMPPTDYFGPLMKEMQALTAGVGGGGGVPKFPQPDMSGFDTGVQQAQDANRSLAGLFEARSAEEVANADRQAKLVNQISVDYTGRIRQAQDDAEKAFQSYLSTPFDPQRLFHNMNAGSGILGAIGILLGGVGSGIRGEPGNPVMGLIDKFIERDVEAQKVDLDRKQSAVSYYMKKGNDLQQAMQLAKADARDKVAAMMAQTAAKYAGGERSAALLAESGKLRMQSAQERQDTLLKAVQAQYQPALIQSQLASQATARKAAQMELFERKFALTRQQYILDQVKADGGNNPWLQDQLLIQTDPKEAAARQITALKRVPTGVVNKDTGQPEFRTVVERRFATSPAVQAKATEQLRNLSNFDERAAYVKEWIRSHPDGKLFPGEDRRAIENAVKELGLSWGPAAEGVTGLNEPEMEEVRQILGSPASWWQAGTGQTNALVKQLDRVSSMAHQSLETYLVPAWGAR